MRSLNGHPLNWRHLSSPRSENPKSSLTLAVECGLGSPHLCTIAENTLWFKWFMVTLIFSGTFSPKDRPSRTFKVSSQVSQPVCGFLPPAEDSSLRGALSCHLSVQALGAPDRAGGCLPLCPQVKHCGGLGTAGALATFVSAVVSHCRSLSSVSCPVWWHWKGRENHAVTILSSV